MKISFILFLYAGNSKACQYLLKYKICLKQTLM